LAQGFGYTRFGASQVYFHFRDPPMSAFIALVLCANALQMHSTPREHISAHKVHAPKQDDDEPPTKNHPLLKKVAGKKASTMCLLQQEETDANDPYCKEGVASHDMKACCQKDCGECNDKSDICKNAATNGRGSTCCPSQILAATAKCTDGKAPCLMSAADSEGLTSTDEKANAAWDCNRAIPDELMRQRVSTDYLRQRGKVLNPEGNHLDCNIKEVHSVEDLAYACEKREGCGGFTVVDGKPDCLLGWTDAKADLSDSPNTDTYIRAVDRENFVFHYEVDPWNPCSVTCGTGEQDRKLYCRNEYGTDYDLSRCIGLHSAGSTPPSKQVCNDFPCDCEDVQSIESNGLTVDSTVTFTYDSRNALSCEGQNVKWTGELQTHCVDWKVGKLEYEDGTCWKKCLKGSEIDSQGATVTLVGDLVHDTDRTVNCPHGYTGQVKLRCDDGTLSIEEGKCWEKCSAKTIFSSLTPPEFNGAASGPTPQVVKDMIHEEEKLFACPSGSTGSWKATCDHGSITAEGSCYYNPVIVEGSFGDWGELSCGSGMHVIGGGCQAANSIFQASRPSDDGQRWICGGFGAGKKIWAICSYMPVEIKEVDGGDWNEVSCGSGAVAIGGGCDAHDSPHKVQFMGSDGNNLEKFKCGGNGSPKATYAICAYDDGEYSMHKVERPDWGSVSCEPGFTQIGGGCDAKASPNVFEASYPMTRYGWKCGGGSGGDQGSRSGAKDVWSTCHATRSMNNCKIETGVMYVGTSGDEEVGTVEVSSADECCLQCGENPSCEYFVFTKPNMCYLKKNWQWKEEHGLGENIIAGTRPEA